MPNPQLRPRPLNVNAILTHSDTAEDIHYQPPTTTPVDEEHHSTTNSPYPSFDEFLRTFDWASAALRESYDEPSEAVAGAIREDLEEREASERDRELEDGEIQEGKR